MYSTRLNMWNHLDLTRLHPVEPKGGFTVFVYSADRGLAAWFERATCWRGAPWLCHQTGRCIFFHFPLLMFSNHSNLSVQYDQTDLGIGLMSCILPHFFSFTQTQDTQGLLLAACVYQIHRQKYDKGDTCFEHVKSFGLDTTSSCWTQRRFYRLRLLSRQRTSRMVWESHMLEGCTVTVSSDGSLHFFPFSTADVQQS